MQKLNLKRLDQHAIVAAVIDDLTMVEIVDGLVGLDFQEKVSTGMVLKAMILNGLGFSNRPLTLTPQFFANGPLESILSPGITAKHFNRHQIGRLLEGLFQYGCTTLFCQISSQAGRLENVERRIQSLDSTSGSTFGADPQSITISHGFCQDHRPGLKPVVVELILAQQGGIPRFIKLHNGKASDSVVFGQPTKALMPRLKELGEIGILVADSELGTKDGSGRSNSSAGSSAQTSGRKGSLNGRSKAQKGGPCCRTSTVPVPSCGTLWHLARMDCL